MSQATQSVAEDAGNVTVCAEISNTTLPLQRSITVLIFSVSSSAGSNYYDPVLKDWFKNDVLLFILCIVELKDFIPINTNLIFSEILPVMCVDIIIVDDTIFDPNESFLVRLLPLDANVTVVDGPLSETEVFIIDNDGRTITPHPYQCI